MADDTVPSPFKLPKDFVVADTNIDFEKLKKNLEKNPNLLKFDKTLLGDKTPTSLASAKEQPFPVFIEATRAQRMPFNMPSKRKDVTREELLNIGPNGDVIAFRRDRDKISLLIEQLKVNGEPLKKSDLKSSSGPLGQFLQSETFRDTPSGSTSMGSGISGAFGAASSEGLGDVIRVEYYTMKNFLLVRQALADEGIHLSADDYLKTENSDTNFMIAAHSQGLFSHIFSPSEWVGRIDEMQKLWDNTKKVGFSENQFEGWKRNALILERPEFKIPSSNIREALFAQDENGTCALDDVRTWKQWTKIKHMLEKSGEQPLSKEELFQTGFLRRPFIDIAFHAGVFKGVQAFLRSSNNAITSEELSAAGLDHIVQRTMDDLKNTSFRAAESVEEYATDAIAFANEKNNGLRIINEKACQSASNGSDAAICKLLELGLDPYPEFMEKYGHSHSEPVLLFAVATKCDQKTTQAVLTALETKYADDPLRLLNALTCFHGGQTILSALETHGKADNTKLVQDAIDRVSEDFLEMDVDELLAAKIKMSVSERNAFDMLVSAGHARELFTIERWLGEARAMQNTFDLVPAGIKQKEFSGENGLPSFEDLLTQVNTHAIKAMAFDEPEA